MWANHIDAKCQTDPKGSNISEAWIVMFVWFGQTYNNLTQVHYNFWFMGIDLQQWAQVIWLNDFRLLRNGVLLGFVWHVCISRFGFFPIWLMCCKRGRNASFARRVKIGENLIDSLLQRDFLRFTCFISPCFFNHVWHIIHIINITHTYNLQRFV